jgi:hypothetical protein
MRKVHITDRKSPLHKWLILGGLGVFGMQTLQGCGGNIPDENSHTYGKEVVQGFIKGCTSTPPTGMSQAQAEKFCSCSIAEFQKKYTYGEFKKASLEARSNRPAPEYLNILTECGKQAGAGS